MILNLIKRKRFIIFSAFIFALSFSFIQTFSFAKKNQIKDTKNIKNNTKILSWNETYLKENTKQANNNELIEKLKEFVYYQKLKKENKNLDETEILLLSKLNDYKKEVDTKEADLKQEYEKLNKNLKEILDLTEKTLNLQVKISETITNKQKENSDRIKRLSSFLEKAKAKDLASFLENIDIDLGIEIIKNLKPKTYANALKYMDKEKATKINQRYISKNIKN